MSARILLAEDNAAKMGFVGYIEKPIHPQTFVAEIARFLPGKAAHA
jgi:CheY-like chemotaxis protein